MNALDIGAAGAVNLLLWIIIIIIVAALAFAVIRRL